MCIPTCFFLILPVRSFLTIFATIVLICFLILICFFLIRRFCFFDPYLFFFDPLARLLPPRFLPFLFLLSASLPLTSHGKLTGSCHEVCSSSTTLCIIECRLCRYLQLISRFGMFRMPGQVPQCMSNVRIYDGMSADAIFQNTRGPPGQYTSRKSGRTYLWRNVITHALSIDFFLLYLLQLIH